jgi:hypothetical protein
METEGVVNVLRHIYRGLAPGGVILDLRSVPPPALVELDGEPIGELDESGFIPRTLENGEALLGLAREGLLVLDREVQHEIVIVYPTGRDLIEDVAGWGSTTVPSELAARVVQVERECAVREFCLARRYRRPPDATGPSATAQRLA